MNPDDWSIGSLGFLAVALWQCVRVIRWIIRRWPELKKLIAPITTDSRFDLPRLFSALVVASGTALFLLSINSGEAPPRFQLLAGALTMLGTLLLVFGAPAYIFTVNLKKDHEDLKGTVKTLAAQNQHLVEEVEALKAQIETRSLEQELPEQQLLFPRKQDALAHGPTDQRDRNKSSRQRKSPY